MASLALILALLAFPASPPTQALRTQQEQPNPADDLVRQLGAFPAALPAMARSDGSIDPIEQRRRELVPEEMLRFQRIVAGMIRREPVAREISERFVG